MRLLQMRTPFADTLGPGQFEGKGLTEGPAITPETQDSLLIELWSDQKTILEISAIFGSSASEGGCRSRESTITMPYGFFMGICMPRHFAGGWWVGRYGWGGGDDWLINLSGAYTPGKLL